MDLREGVAREVDHRSCRDLDRRGVVARNYWSWINADELEPSESIVLKARRFDHRPPLHKVVF